MTDYEIGKRVVLFREPMSQQAVATAMRQQGHKWSQATVWSVEKGERPLRLSEAVALADVIGVTLHDIAGVDTDAAALFSENNEMRKQIRQIREVLL